LLPLKHTREDIARPPGIDEMIVPNVAISCHGD
jgi:hypothetical protein